MEKTDEQLWKEISNKRDEAQRHGQAVNEVRAAVDRSAIDGVYSIGYLPVEDLNYLQMLMENELEYFEAKKQAA